MPNHDTRINVRIDPESATLTSPIEGQAIQGHSE
jgi:hypothetical protein